MKFLAFLFSIPLFGASLFVDLGPPDPYCTGGARYDIATPGATGDLTLLYGAFTCKIPQSPGAYLVTLNFRETGTVTGNGQRIFSVKINDQLVLDRFDLFAAAGLVPLSKPFLALSDGNINIVFNYSLKSAVISSIQIDPLAVTQYVIPSDPQKDVITGAIPVWMNDAYMVPGTRLNWDLSAIVNQNIAVYRNGVRETGFTATTVGQLTIIPTNRQPWPETVLVDYTAILPVGAVPE